MHLFYPRYHAQSFYRNTFLVNRPQEIARAEKSDREWNNLAESGYHFTCLAMIAGVDPALLADAAIKTGYYRPDKDLPARALDGKRGPLVWDPDVMPSSEKDSGVTRGTLQAMVEGGLPLRAWGKLCGVRKFSVVAYELRLKD